MPKKEIKFGQVFTAKLAGTHLTQQRVVLHVGTEGQNFISAPLDGSVRSPVIAPISRGTTNITTVEKWKNTTLSPDKVFEAIKKGHIRANVALPAETAETLRRDAQIKSRVITWEKKA